MTDTQKALYEEGREARKRGSLIPDGCPYTNDFQRWWWNFGWHMADADIADRKAVRAS